MEKKGVLIPMVLAMAAAVFYLLAVLTYLRFDQEHDDTGSSAGPAPAKPNDTVPRRTAVTLHPGRRTAACAASAMTLGFSASGSATRIAAALSASSP